MFFRCFSPCRRFWCRRRCSFHQVFGCPPDGLNKFLIYLRKKHYCFSSELLLFQYLSNSSVNLELGLDIRSEEHTSELQSLMRISYAVFCLKKKTTIDDIIKL